MIEYEKLELLTECEKRALPIAFLAMLMDITYFGGKKEGKTATTKETNISFTWNELVELYGKEDKEFLKDKL